MAELEAKDHEEPPQTQTDLPESEVGEKTTKSTRCSKHGKKAGKCCSPKKEKKGKKDKKKKSVQDDSSSESSSSESTASDSSDSSDSDSDDEQDRRRQKKKAALKKKEKKKAAAKKAKKRKSRKNDSSSDDSDSSSSDESDTDSEEEERKRKKRKARKAAKAEESSTEEDTPEATPDATPPADDDTTTALASLRTQLAQLELANLTQAANPAAAKKKPKSKKKDKKPGKKGVTLEYKRVDQVWDRNIYNYKFTESAEKTVDEFDEFVFVVRRKFDWENKYSYTRVDIKSKPLREALQEVLKEVKGVSLVEDQPSIDPNMLFLYLDELKTYYRKTLRVQMKKEKKKKLKKRMKLQILHCKILAAYLDEDYEDTKKTLNPMLKAGNITFDLLWALFKPNTIAFTPTYGSAEDPRCFKVDYANKERHPLRGEWYAIEGRYLEYDGKVFGLGDFEMPVESFKGPRKITSLAAYPLEYHKDPEGVRKQLVERGKKFVALQGMNYKFHKGLAFQKKKKAILKTHINGRVMIDPSIFRRVNPNYPISYVKRREDDDSPNAQEDSDEEDCSQCCGGDSDDEAPIEGAEGPANFGEEERTKVKVYIDENAQVRVVHVPVDKDGNEIVAENLDAVEGDDSYVFSEEELLIASPVVLGFGFAEKAWFEFSLSGIQDIEWNDKAFSSLVLHQHVKNNLKGLVSTHKFHPAKTIDDVIQGKGKGLNVVLHGPPGVGKTLTAESIAEYLKCPLYSVSAGELGTDSRMLEAELNKIMDITHSWGAILLLDEADVFLEKREIHDIHRNALVSIFLRLLEYYQGILFLTTNRVETFDDAFQSRIHMGIRYENLSRSARKEVWSHHVGSVLKMEGQRFEPFEKEHFDELSKATLNGRQIKNAVKSAQSISLSNEEPFSMKHIKGVLQVQEDFDADLKGGNGYINAQRMYN
ncbi:hypothetical protein BCR34DRAFT_596219 [Clohesyomyces aquaticus]|uniref:AAA+ ATPase domain-containing protein n=1 Tax=Clohesyomyces aquaticus TaxID=1231657 RepID=A0A1Y2A841_9PLEO|nr:hypothetical protein BCR34DRAFT_596219 [Clohesyomyces aquaticus]